MDEENEDLKRTLAWIILRFETEVDAVIKKNKKKINWKKAAEECVDEAYGVLGRYCNDLTKYINKD